MSVRPSDLLSGDEFLTRFMANMIPNNSGYSVTRRHIVTEWFGVGATHAGTLCRWLGYDPDERVQMRRVSRK